LLNKQILITGWYSGWWPRKVMAARKGNSALVLMTLGCMLAGAPRAKALPLYLVTSSQVRYRERLHFQSLSHPPSPTLTGIEVQAPFTAPRVKCVV
jgi:hypothetical protein